MSFIWVNGRMPASSLVCAACARPIRASYLRHIKTRLVYCDPNYDGSVCPDDHAIRPINEHEAGAILKSTLEPFQEVQSRCDWLQEIREKGFVKVLVRDSSIREAIQ